MGEHEVDALRYSYNRYLYYMDCVKHILNINPQQRVSTLLKKADHELDRYFALQELAVDRMNSQKRLR